MKITLVAAIASNNVIGKENSLPWNIPEDLKRFKQMTSGHTILMGRKTFDSIGRRRAFLSAIPKKCRYFFRRSI